MHLGVRRGRIEAAAGRDALPLLFVSKTPAQSPPSHSSTQETLRPQGRRGDGVPGSRPLLSELPQGAVRPQGELASPRASAYGSRKLPGAPMVSPQSPSNSPATPGAAQPAASRGDELLPGVGHTMYEFQGQGTGPGMGDTDLGLSMGRPQRSNLGSGRGAGWVIGLLVVAGAAVAFWLISGGMGGSSGSQQEEQQASDNAVAGDSTKGVAQTKAPEANAGDTQVEVPASSTATPVADKAQAEAAAKAKADKDAAQKAQAEAEAKKKAAAQAAAQAAAKKKAEQAAKDAAAAKAKADKAAAAKKKAKKTPKKPAKKSTKKPAKKKSSKVKRIKPRPKNSGLDGLPDPD